MNPRITRGLKFASRYSYALMASGYLFSMGFLNRKHRPLVRAICDHFGYGNSRVKPIVPQSSLSDFFADATPVVVRCPETVAGNVSLTELLVLADSIRKYSPRVLLEIGTFDGRTTLNMAANSADDAKIYTLDLPVQTLTETKWPLLTDEISAVGQYKRTLRFQGSDCEHKIVQCFGDSATFDFSGFAEKVDFAFIDGSHQYDYVLNDTQKVLSVVKGKGSIVFWHDYAAWDDVTRALNEMYSSGQLRGLRHIKGTTLAYVVC